MSYLNQIEPEEAPPDVLRMYKGIEKQRGLIFNNLNRFNRFMSPDLDMEPPPEELMALLSEERVMRGL